MTTAEPTAPAEDTAPDAEFMYNVVRLLKGWQEADRDPDALHREVDRLAVWTRHDGRVYLTASTGAAVVAVDCTGADLSAYEPAHSRVAAVLEGETYAPQVVDLIAFWEWLGDATVDGKCPACSRRFGKVFGSPYNLGIIRGALGSVYHFLDRDAEVDWKRLVLWPHGGPLYRAARLESDGQWIVAFLSLNVERRQGRFDPEWPRDYEIINA